MRKVNTSLAGAVLATLSLFAGSASGTYLETFSYPDGNLPGNGGWSYETSDPGINAVEVLSGQAAVYAAQPTPLKVTDASMNVLPTGANVVDLYIDVKRVPLDGDTGGAGWFHVMDLSGSVLLGGLFWNNSSLFGRNAATGSLVGLGDPGTGGVTVHMKFDYTANTVTFDTGGAPIGTSAFAPGLTPGNEGVGKVTFEAQTNSPRTAYHLFDNLNIVPEPATLGLSLLAFPLLLRRRR